MAMTPTEFGKKPTVDAIWSILDTRLHLVFKRNELGDVMFPCIADEIPYYKEVINVSHIFNNIKFI